jgi:hypothetical protein
LAVHVWEEVLDHDLGLGVHGQLLSQQAHGDPERLLPDGLQKSIGQ